MSKLQKDLEYAIHEIIWMTLENQKLGEPTSCTLIDDLFELAKGGPVGRAGAPAQNLHFFIKQLAADCIKAVAEEEATQDGVYAE